MKDGAAMASVAKNQGKTYLVPRFLFLACFGQKVTVVYQVSSDQTKNRSVSALKSSVKNFPTSISIAAKVFWERREETLINVLV